MSGKVPDLGKLYRAIEFGWEPGCAEWRAEGCRCSSPANISPECEFHGASAKPVEPTLFSTAELDIPPIRDAYRDVE